MATASNPAVPSLVSDGGTLPMGIVRDGDAPPSPNAHPPSIGTLAAQLGAAAARAAVEHVAGASKSTIEGKPPPRQPTMLPAWLSIVLALAFGTGGAGAIVATALSLRDDEEVKELKTEFAAFKVEIAADRALLHKNDAALGKWAVDFSGDVSAGLVSLDEVSRAIATAQGVDTSDIAKVKIAQPNPTVRGLGIQAELEGL